MVTHVVSFYRVSSLQSVYISDYKAFDTVDHTFVYTNLGPSLMPTTAVSVSIPQVQMGGQALLHLNKTTVTCVHPCSVTCALQGGSVYPDVYMDIAGRHRIHNTTNDSLPKLPDVNNLVKCVHIFKSVVHTDICILAFYLLH